MCEYLIVVIALAVKAARVTTLDTVAELHLLGFSYDFTAGGANDVLAGLVILVLCFVFQDLSKLLVVNYFKAVAVDMAL